MRRYYKKIDSRRRQIQISIKFQINPEKRILTIQKTSTKNSSNQLQRTEILIKLVQSNARNYPTLPRGSTSIGCQLNEEHLTIEFHYFFLIRIPIEITNNNQNNCRRDCSGCHLLMNSKSFPLPRITPKLVSIYRMGNHCKQIGAQSTCLSRFDCLHSLS